MGQEDRAQQLDADSSGGVTWHFPLRKLILEVSSHVPRDKGKTPRGHRSQSKGLLRICSVARPQADRCGVDFPHFEARLNHGRLFVPTGVQPHLVEVLQGFDQAEAQAVSDLLVRHLEDHPGVPLGEDAGDGAGVSVRPAKVCRGPAKVHRPAVQPKLAPARGWQCLSRQTQPCQTQRWPAQTCFSFTPLRER